jgi:hypothetical protein
MEFAFAVRCRRVPFSFNPVDIRQRTTRAPVHSTAEVNEAIGSLDEGRQHVGSERVNRQRF